jgi:hypothetical protein
VIDQTSDDIDVLVGRTRLSEQHGRRIAVASFGDARAEARVRCTTGRWRGSRARFAFAWTRLGDETRRVLGRGAT